MPCAATKRKSAGLEHLHSAPQPTKPNVPPLLVDAVPPASDELSAKDMEDCGDQRPTLTQKSKNEDESKEPRTPDDTDTRADERTQKIQSHIESKTVARPDKTRNDNGQPQAATGKSPVRRLLCLPDHVPRILGPEEPILIDILHLIVAVVTLTLSADTFMAMTRFQWALFVIVSIVGFLIAEKLPNGRRWVSALACIFAGSRLIW